MDRLSDLILLVGPEVFRASSAAQSSQSHTSYEADVGSRWIRESSERLGSLYKATWLGKVGLEPGALDSECYCLSGYQVFLGHRTPSCHTSLSFALTLLSASGLCGCFGLFSRNHQFSWVL